MSSSSSWLFLLCLCLLTCCCCSSVFGRSEARCPENQSSLLLKLKQGFSFKDGHPRLGSWVLGWDCCLWEGVTCDNATGLIISLDLSPLSFLDPSYPLDPILGWIDPSLFQLVSLRSLDLSWFNFLHEVHPIPSGLGQLTNLRHLNLSNAFFSGQIPLDIYGLTRLVSLDLSYTRFQPEMLDLKTWLHNMTALEQLYLGGIHISLGTTNWSLTIPSALPHLRELGLMNCGLSGPIHASLLQLPFLTKLSLRANDLSLLTADSFSNPSSIRLRYLDLSNCHLGAENDQLLKKIFQLPNLHTLDLSFNNISTGAFPSIPPNNNVSLRFLRLQESLNGILPKSIFNLKFLDHLDLSRSFLTGGIPENVGDLKFMNHLDFSENQLTGGIPKNMGDLKFLKHLDLSKNQLMGWIPETIGNLTLITHLDLSDNHFTGGIPSSFKHLLDLSHLSLTNNAFNGTIPSFLLNLPSLQELNLRSNLFHGSLSEITNPSSPLSILDLSINNLTGPIPSSIAHLTQLEFLKLSFNNFNGIIQLGWFYNFTNLNILDLSDNNFTVEFNNYSIDNAPLFSSLESLLLRSCNMSEFQWLFLYKQTALFVLDLSNNRIPGVIPNWIWQFEYLNYLNLSLNLLTALEQPANLSLSNLDTLDLHANMLEGTLPVPPRATFLDYSINRFSSKIPDFGHHISQLPSYFIRVIDIFSGIYFLSLSGNKLIGEIPPAVCNSSLLEVLDMSYNRLTGSIPLCLTNMTYLSILSLRGNYLQGKIPDVFIETSSLRTLDLNSNRFSGPVPKSLVHCTKLEILDLGNNHLFDTFPSWLETLPHLRVLVLRSNQFHGLIKPNKTRQGFQMMQIIDISKNNFTGYLPMEYFKSWKFMREKAADTADKFLKYEDNIHPQVVLFSIQYQAKMYYQDSVNVSSKRLEMMFKKIPTILMSVDLSNNEFYGRIPEELGNLKFLIVLNLSRNNLDGQIPISLGNLLSVESMDLSHNSLSGHIPTQLATLNFLAVLDLSYNKLTGRIPDGTQFSTFPSASFEGNQGLCGPPLSLKCTTTSPMEPPEVEAKNEVDQLEFIVGGIVGFFCGMALIMWPLFVWRSWRIRYYHHVDKVLFCIFDAVARQRG